MVRRQFKEWDIQSFLIIYKGFVRPHLEYAIQAWSPRLRRDIDCLERVQRRPTKMVKGFCSLQYELRLKRWKLTLLEKRRQRDDLIEAYKVLTGKEGVDPHCFFTADKNQYSTKGHELKLHQNKQIGNEKNFFHVNEWCHIGTSCQKQWSWLSLLTFSRIDSTDVKSGAFKASSFSSPTTIYF